MADSQAKKGYSIDRPHTPSGAVAQPNMLSPTAAAGVNHKRGSAEAEAMQAPASTPASVALGQTMYQTYCSPCHGSDGVNLGAVAQPGRFPGVVPLAGAAGIAKLRSDPWIYLTIRNGGAVMPSYSWAMSDEEMWAVVHYVRTLNGAAYQAPEPAEDSP
jgi:mono/diheme cytochrome c family protein